MPLPSLYWNCRIRPYKNRGEWGNWLTFFSFSSNFLIFYALSSTKSLKKENNSTFYCFLKNNQIISRWGILRFKNKKIKGNWPQIRGQLLTPAESLGPCISYGKNRWLTVKPQNLKNNPIMQPTNGISIKKVKQVW